MIGTKIPVLIVGATGQLGGLITKHCLQKPNLQVNILVRNPDKNRDLVDEIQKAGGRVLKGDVTQPESLKDCTKDIHTVISALIGNDETVYDGQKALLDDALKHDVKRMVPSDFSLWPFRVEEDNHPFIAQRLKFKKHLETTSVKGLHVWLGMFMETFFFFMKEGLHYYEFPDRKIDMTAYEDAAKFVAAAVAKPDRVGDLRIRGDEVSINEIAEIYNRVRGKNLKLSNSGTIEELKKRTEEFKKQGEFLKSAWAGFELYMFDGRGKLDNVDNEEFPEVKPQSFEEFLKNNADRKLPESS